MDILARAVKYMGVFKGAINAIRATDMTQIRELVEQTITAVERVAQRTAGMTGPEKKKLATTLILERIKAPFFVKWALKPIINYVVEWVVTEYNGFFGRFWGTGEPDAGYATVDELPTVPLPVPAIQEAEGTAKAVSAASVLSVDGVNTASVMAAIKIHNKTQTDRCVHVLGTLAQTALETGNYKHFRAFNLAGIKSTPGWEKVGGKVWQAGTSEFQGGKMVKTTGWFRAYDDLGHFLDDYAGMIHRCYPVTAQNIDCVWLYLAGFYKGKYGAWATDPNYYGKLCAMTVRHAPVAIGEGWQEQLARAYQLARQRGFPAEWMEQAVLKAIGG